MGTYKRLMISLLIAMLFRSASVDGASEPCLTTTDAIEVALKVSREETRVTKGIVTEVTELLKDAKKRFIAVESNMNTREKELITKFNSSQKELKSLILCNKMELKSTLESKHHLLVSEMSAILGGPASQVVSASSKQNPEITRDTETQTSEIIDLRDRITRLESGFDSIQEELSAMIKSSLPNVESAISLNLMEVKSPLTCDSCTPEAVTSMPGVTLQVKVSNHRYISHGSLLLTLNVSIDHCGATCYQNGECVSFNYKNIIGTCELLNTAPYQEEDPGLITSTLWKHYIFVAPKKKDVNESDLCPTGSFLIWYDQPVYLKYNSSLPGYTCTRHPWVKEEHSKGNTECRMVLVYDRAVVHHHRGAYRGPYHKALTQCLSKNCVGMTCKPGICWVQHDTHLTKNVALEVRPGYLNWHTVCQ